MSLLLAGIDEAGYGPTLGPLTVGLSIFRLNDIDPAMGTPNLWDLLGTGVCKEPGRGGKSDAKGRIAIADSKRLKLANSVSTTHPLVHLERGVLACMASREGCGDEPCTTDDSLLKDLGTAWPDHACYAGGPSPLPVAHAAAELGIAGSILARSLSRSNIDLVTLRCRLMPEREFNAIVRSTGSKAQATSTALAEHLRHAWNILGTSPDGTRLGIVCDRQGGRMTYADLLDAALPNSLITIIEETEARSQYTVEKDGRRAGIAFLVEAESAHLPVALASMVAKYVRELAMARFNRSWSRRCVELKRDPVRPTAGYALDARRWLDDMNATLTREDRESLVRIA
jgi:hypothetical protein